METAFYITAVIAVLSTIMVITRHNPVHALLYLIISLLSLAMIFYLLGAPFAALLEVIIYAGAIMVLFIFAIMLLNLGPETSRQEKVWLGPSVWVGPSILAVILLAELVYLILTHEQAAYQPEVVEPMAVAKSLFSAYMIGVQLVGLLLMAGVVGAAHIAQHKKVVTHRFLERSPL
ncbi:MAG TPA: NADH-quinone oxidoreductase subunit J [Sphingobacteriaceae bacterium]